MAVALLIAGKDQKNKKSSGSISKQEKETKTTELILCEFSEEAKRVELGEFVDRVRQRILNFTSLRDVYRDPEMTTKRVKTESVA